MRISLFQELDGFNTSIKTISLNTYCKRPFLGENFPWSCYRIVGLQVRK